MNENNFKFWCPIEKSITFDPTDGENKMRLGGIASTSDEDSDGEFLDPKGFDINPLLKSGLVNWHHRAKDQPNAIIGEPIKAEIKPEGLYIETELYSSSKIAQDVWELAETLEKNSKTRRLGYSIEGKVVKRKSEDKNSPDYKKIQKAIITGVAITHQPKNPKTFANIIKGEIDDNWEDDKGEASGYSIEDIAEKHDVNVTKIKKQLEIGTKVEMEHTDDEDEARSIAIDHLVELPNYYDKLKKMEKEGKEEIKKDLSTETASVLKKESLDKKIKSQVFTKSEVMDKIFRDLPAIKITKAEKVYNLIKKITEMSARKTITAEDIEKAYDALGLPYEVEDIKKGVQEAEELDKKFSKSKDEEEETKNEEEETFEKEETKDEDEDDEEKDVKKADSFEKRFDRIEKAISLSHLNNTKYIKALGVMVKDSSVKLEKAAEREIELLDILKAQDETISELNSKIEDLSLDVPAPKSLSNSKPVERAFSKSNENDFSERQESNTNQVSMSRQSGLVSEILDQAAFAKGFDEEFSKALMSFEASKTLPANILSRVKKEYGIEIVK